MVSVLLWDWDCWGLESAFFCFMGVLAGSMDIDAVLVAGVGLADPLGFTGIPFLQQS